MNEAGASARAFRARARVFFAIPLRVLDLSVCRWIKVDNKVDGGFEVPELRLPALGFAEVAAKLLPYSRVEVLEANVDDAAVRLLLPRLTSWGFDRLRIVSSRLEAPLDWAAEPLEPPQALIDPSRVATMAAVTMTIWREVPVAERGLVRSLDLSALPIAEFPRDSQLIRCGLLESVVLPRSLRVLARNFFAKCVRLSHVGTAGCTSLEIIGWSAFADCLSLAEFWFPPTAREVEDAFGGTAITSLDLSETRATRVRVNNMIFLERLIVPRRCALDGASGFPALRKVAFGALSEGQRHSLPPSWRPREVRFESMKSPESPKLVDCLHVHAEVAAVLSRESAPSFPP